MGVLDLCTAGLVQLRRAHGSTVRGGSAVPGRRGPSSTPLGYDKTAWGVYKSVDDIQVATVKQNGRPLPDSHRLEIWKDDWHGSKRHKHV